MSDFVEQFASDLEREARRIERDKRDKALTPAEADKVKAAHFLRQIAPYLFGDPNHDQ